MIIALAFVVIIILALIYFISEKVGYIVNVAFVIAAGLFNYLAYGFLLANVYVFGPLSGFYGETESGLSLVACILPPIIIVIISFGLYQGMDKIRDEIHLQRGRKEFAEYLENTKEGKELVEQLEKTEKGKETIRHYLKDKKEGK